MRESRQVTRGKKKSNQCEIHQVSIKALEKKIQVEKLYGNNADQTPIRHLELVKGKVVILTNE